MALIKVLFTHPRKFYIADWLIRAFTWAPYCHAALQINGRVFQATEDGSDWTLAKTFNEKHETVAAFEITLTEADFHKLIFAAKKLQHIRYDWWADIGIGLYRVFPWLRRNPLANEKKALFCSELVYYCLEHAGVIPPFTGDPETLDPKRLLRYLEKFQGPTVRRVF